MPDFVFLQIFAGPWNRGLHALTLTLGFRS